ncbi:MAG TPA: hypothetical protein VLH79_03020 [Chthonomonadales bacterium]|nr:hypothetical protein [Chthonomonadales bacterium]
MLKITEVRPSRSVTGEYVVLQNQGLMTVALRGWVLCSEAYLQGLWDQRACPAYVFRTETAVKPYQRVVVFTGEGDDGWYSTVDGKLAYVAYWGRHEPVWSRVEQVFVLHCASSRRIAALGPPAVAGHRPWNASPRASRSDQ